MKYSIAFAALVAVAAAQVDSSILPECAQKCLSDATTSATTCKVGDYACTCEAANKAAIQTAATSCVIAACGVDKALNEVLPASDKLCAAAASAGGGASSTPAPATSASSAASAAASTVVSSVEVSASLPIATSVSTVSTSVVATTTSQAATTAAGNATASTSAPVQAGAAGIAPIGGLAMLILGALAI